MKVTTAISLDRELLVLIDEKRGLVSRSAFINAKLKDVVV